MEGHGGELAMAALAQAGVGEIFTLSGGHVFPLYDAAVKTGVRIVDVRHEQTAGFAAEGLARLLRRPGVAVVTAGPGVTNVVSAVAAAASNGAPVVVLAGRAPAGRWGAGSLQEIDHVPFVAPLTKHAATVTSPEAIAPDVAAALALATTAHRGPVFLDLPLDVVFSAAALELAPDATLPPPTSPPDPDVVTRAAAALAGAERPAIIAGGDVWAGRAEGALVRAAEALRVPVFMNGQGRGCLPADHELAFSRARSLLGTQVDVVAVVGTPLDFRLRFGDYGSAQVIHIVDAPGQVAPHVPKAISAVGDIATALDGLATHAGPRSDHEAWIATLTDVEAAARAADAELLGSDSDPIHPARIYGELVARLDPDAVVVCDGGDFASYAGRFIDVARPGCWLDAGPFGCLGSGPGHALAARLAHPDRQVVALLGDGAFGFSGMEFDTAVRHGLPFVAVIGNNGIWGLEKHPMQAIYGYDVAADLQPGCRYDQVVTALGGAGEVVERPNDIGPALDRALAAGVPYVVNVLTDPTNAYPRTSNLA